MRRILIRLYALTHPRQVNALRTWPNAKEMAYSMRRHRLPYRTYLAVDHLGFHYDPVVLQGNWLGRRLWGNWGERERQQRERGRAGLLSLTDESAGGNGDE